MNQLVNGFDEKFDPDFEEQIVANNGALLMFHWIDLDVDPATAAECLEYHSEWFSTGYYVDGPSPPEIAPKFGAYFAVINLTTGVLMGKDVEGDYYGTPK